MKVARPTDADFAEKLCRSASASSLFDPTIEERARAILDAVRTRGDEALLEFTERFDGAKLDASELAVTQAESMAASLKADDSLRKAVGEAERNIARFAQKSRRKAWKM